MGRSERERVLLGGWQAGAVGVAVGVAPKVVDVVVVVALARAFARGLRQFRQSLCPHGSLFAAPKLEISPSLFAFISTNDIVVSIPFLPLPPLSRTP